MTRMSNSLFTAVLQHEQESMTTWVRYCGMHRHGHGVRVRLRWCQDQFSEAEGPQDSGDVEVAEVDRGVRWGGRGPRQQRRKC